MSQNLRVNLQYLYSKENIDCYVNNIIKYKLGGFKKDEHSNYCKYLLNNKFEVGINSFYVFYLHAQDSVGKFCQDFFFDKSKQFDVEKIDDLKDVFDELKHVLLSEENCKAKLLFPYNKTNIWLIGEIVIDKKGNNVSLVIYTHSPYGGGKLSKKNFSTLNKTLQIIIEKNGLKVTSVSSLQSPFTNARQNILDKTSSGVIVADEIVKRITNSSLTISSPYPLGVEQLRLSQLTFLNDNLGEDDLNYLIFKEQVNLIENRLEEYSCIANLNYNARPTIEEKLAIPEVRKKVEHVVNSEESSTLKIIQLMQLEKEHYKPLIHQLAYKESQEELKDLVMVLTDLGHLTVKLGELSGDLKYYTEAAVFYQYVISILDGRLNEKLINEENKNEFIKQEKLNSHLQLTHILQLIFLAIGGKQDKMPLIQEEAKANKDLLLALRNKTDQEMQKIEGYDQQAKTDNQKEKKKYEKLYVNSARVLFEKIASEMKSFLSKLYSDSEKQISFAPPCKYSVIGLGSMALKQMTPYSDFEFAILTENEHYKQSNDSKIQDYFKNLSHLVNFKMINLGESIIPKSKYDLDMEHLVRRAVNLDLGGKTPLGRIDNDKPYELIKTVKWMMHYVRNEDDKAVHIDKNLPYILENVCYVYGEHKLVNEFQSKVTEFLHNVVEDKKYGVLKNCEIRAIKLLIEEAKEIDYSKLSSKPKYPKFDFNIDSNKPKGDLGILLPNFFEDEARHFDVKKDIYRLSDRLLYNLGLYYGCEGESSWDTIDKLKDKSIINLKAAVNLKKALTFATTLRLKIYSHHKAQQEDMSIFVESTKTESEIIEQGKQKFYLHKSDLKEDGRLFQYFYTALPLYEKLEKFCTKQETLNDVMKKSFFLDNEFYKDDFVSKGFIYYRLGKYKKAQSNLELALDDPNNKDNLQIILTLGNIYCTFGNFNQAIKNYDYCLKEYKLLFEDKPHPSIADILNNLGNVYADKRESDQAINYYQKSIEMRKLVYRGEPHSSIADSFNNIGAVYADKGNYDQAINCYEESLKIKKLIHKDERHISFAVSFNNLGELCRFKGQFDEAINYYKKSLEIYKLIHKDQLYPYIAYSFNNLGAAYGDKGHFDQAIYYYKESLKIKKLIYKKVPHSSIANSFLNLGAAYADKGQHDKAINYYNKSLETYKLIHKDQHHPAFANSFNNLGAAYDAKGQYDEAIKYYKKSLKIRKLVYKEEYHPSIADSLNNLGLFFSNKGQYDQANKYYKKSLKIKKLVYKEKYHPSIADSLNNIGLNFYNKGQYDQASKYYKKSLKIKKLVYKEEYHPEIAGSLNNIGAAYAAKGKYDEAVEYYTKSLKMYNLIHEGQSHPSMADIINNLGTVYHSKGQLDDAITYYKESIDMKKIIYKDKNHTSIADSFNNLGSIYSHKGQYDHAIHYYKKGLAMYETIHKDQPHPRIADFFNNLALAYADKKYYDEADNYYKKSLKIYKLIHNDQSHPNIAMSLNNLGELCKIKEQYDKAINYYKESLEIYKRFHKEEPHPDVAATLKNLGLAYDHNQQYDQAIIYHSQALHIISGFHDHIYTNIIKNSLITSSMLLAEKYSLNPQKVVNKILSLALIGSDFSDYAIHVQSALSTDDNNEREKQEIIEEYQLALIFHPKDKTEIITDICNKLAKLTGEDYKNIELWLAITEGNTEKVMELINNDGIIDSILFTNTTPLISAIVKENIEMVSALISRKADINKHDNNQDQISPLYYSLGFNEQPINMQIVELLLRNGADANKPMFDGDTPMHMAHYKGHKKAIRLLWRYNANISIRNAEGKTPLHYLLENKDVSTSTMLEIFHEFYQLCDSLTIKDIDDNIVVDDAKKCCSDEMLTLLTNGDPIYCSNSFLSNANCHCSNTNSDISLNIEG